MDQPDVEIDFEPSEELTERVVKRGKKLRKGQKISLTHRMRLLNQASIRAQTIKQQGHGFPKARKITLAPLPWDKKD